MSADETVQADDTATEEDATEEVLFRTKSRAASGREESTGEEPTEEELPILAVRDTVIFPGALLPITVGRPASIALVQSLGENRLLAVVSQLDPRVEAPRPERSLPDRHRLRDAQSAARAEGQPAAVLRRHRAHAHPRVHRHRAVSCARASSASPKSSRRMTPEMEALRQNVLSLFQQIVAASPNLSDDCSSTANHITEAGPPGRFRRRQSAQPEPRRAPETARDNRRRRSA